MNLRDAIGLQVVAAHRRLYNLTGGRFIGGLGGMPVLELTTRGAQSGKPRKAMLTSPVRHQGHLVIVASRGGDERHPSWYHNLVANPDVEVKIKGDTTSMTARVASAEERAELWPKVTQAYKGYAGYQEKTDREIPLVILEP